MNFWNSNIASLTTICRVLQASGKLPRNFWKIAKELITFIRWEETAETNKNPFLASQYWARQRWPFHLSSWSTFPSSPLALHKIFVFFARFSLVFPDSLIAPISSKSGCTTFKLRLFNIVMDSNHITISTTWINFSWYASFKEYIYN